MCVFFSHTGVMVASEIPPSDGQFPDILSQGPFFPVRTFFRHFAHCYFVLNFSLSAQKQHILVLRNTPNCSSVHSGMTGISLAELALHNRCDQKNNQNNQKKADFWAKTLLFKQMKIYVFQFPNHYFGQNKVVEIRDSIYY